MDRGEAGGRAENAVCRRGVLERLAAVRHHRAQELEVGRRQRAPEERQLAGAGVAVRIIDRDQFELRVHWSGDADADTNQALPEQHAVGRSELRASTHRHRARSSRRWSEDRIRAPGGIEARPHVGWRDRPAGARLVAAHTGATVGPQVLEEWPVRSTLPAVLKVAATPVGLAKSMQRCSPAMPGR